MAAERDGGTEKIRIGKISGAQGLRGELRLYHDSGDEEALRRLTLLLLRIGASEAAYGIEGLRFQKRVPVIKLCGVEDRSAAEALCGAEVYALLSEARPKDEDSWLVSDLEGLGVFLDGAAGGPLGRVRSVIDNPAHDILEIETAGGILLLPFVDVFIRKVDIEGGGIYIDPPEGWLE